MIYKLIIREATTASLKRTMASMVVGEREELKNALFRAFMKDSKQVDVEKPRKGVGKKKKLLLFALIKIIE